MFVSLDYIGRLYRALQETLIADILRNWYLYPVFTDWPFV